MSLWTIVLGVMIGELLVSIIRLFIMFLFDDEEEKKPTFVVVYKPHGDDDDAMD